MTPNCLFQGENWGNPVPAAGYVLKVAWVCGVDVQVMSECPSMAVFHQGFTAGSGIPEPQIASVWEGLEGECCYMLGLFHTCSWASAVVSCQR